MVEGRYTTLFDMERHIKTRVKPWPKISNIRFSFYKCVSSGGTARVNFSSCCLVPVSKNLVDLIVTWDVRVESQIQLLNVNIVMCFSTMSNSLLLYTVKRIRPKQLPFGSHCFRGKVDETPSFHGNALRTICQICTIQALCPSTPNLNLRRLSRVSCRTVSKAALRSKSTRRVTSCASILRRMSFFT